jgi:glycosyltransferase involved in cell wall biosynthesis
MRDLAILIPCWKAPELLKVCIPSLKESITTDSEIIVILNEADKESIGILDSLGVKHIDKETNDGPSAIDHAIDMIGGFQYVTNSNSDMLFHKGWDGIVIEKLESHYPCTVSPTLVEPNKTDNTVIYDYLGDFSTTDNINSIFNEKVKGGLYASKEVNSYRHPITCTVEDYLAVNGYSDNFRKCWVDLKGKGLDDDFPLRLKKKNNNYQFIRINSAFVYHGISINSSKLKRRPTGQNAFKQLNGISIKKFQKTIGFGKER